MINQKLEGNAVAAHRVKLFVTTQRGDWDDRGTGFLVPTPDGFRINSEAQLCDLLLNHTIRALEYKQQSDNILLWTESSGTSLAISFQSSAQTRELLEHICNVQRRDSSVIRNEEEGNEVVLPLPTFEALPAIQDILTLSTQKPAVARAVASGDFLSSLATLFKKAECNKSPSLPHFFAIYKSFGKR